MSELKLCPMRTEGADLFFPCIQEKCAWWVKEREMIEHHFAEAENAWQGSSKTVPSHCVALDWGKK